jgi:RNA-directed DNA polymerase
VDENQIGTPQGGVISPILCNVALNGLEKAMIIENARGSGRNNPNNKVHLIRYADDFVIIAPTKTALELRIEIAQEFLQTRGLEISPTKSKITTIYEGFDFNVTRPSKKQNSNIRNKNTKSSINITKRWKRGDFTC